MLPRRRFLVSLGAVLPGVALSPRLAAASPTGGVDPAFSSRLKLSLNCYSFNTPLRAGTTDLFRILRFCAEHNIDGIDPTGYYFPGYPEVPPDEWIYRFRREAFLLGIGISGTGVRNDFTLTDPAKRKAGVDLVKNWLQVAAKLGAPTLRIFAGTSTHEGNTRDEVFEWMAADIRECAEYGKSVGVVVALQNHYDFLKNADDILRIFSLVDHPWLGLNLDIGSFRTDPYDEIRRTLPLAVTWQIKENMVFTTEEVKTDYRKLFALIRKSGYRGYLPLETLGSGDPFRKITVMLAEVRKALQTMRSHPK